jgi:hypothetical protein
VKRAFWHREKKVVFIHPLLMLPCKVQPSRIGTEWGELEMGRRQSSFRMHIGGCDPRDFLKESSGTE